VVKCKVIPINSEVSHAEEIEERKQEITELYRKSFTEIYIDKDREENKKKRMGKYREAYKNKCNDFLLWLDENEIASVAAKRFCYLMISYYYFDEKQNEIALQSAEYALKYSEGLDIYKIYQMIGIIQKELKNKSKALQYLNKSFAYYREHNLFFEMAQIYDIKGELLSSESMFKKAIKLYGQAENTESANERKYDYDKFRNRVYRRLLRLYILNGEKDFIKCYKLYNQIKDAALKKETEEMIIAAYGKEV
jgi:tetratricopeptide (TPR) repeat protein